MENYNNTAQVGLLMAQILQEWRFESPYQVKNHDQLRYLVKAKGKSSGRRKLQIPSMTM